MNKPLTNEALETIAQAASLPRSPGQGDQGGEVDMETIVSLLLSAVLVPAALAVFLGTIATSSALILLALVVIKAIFIPNKEET